LKKRKRTISDYQKAINNYQNASDKERKREFQQLIDDIKTDFTSGISRQAVDRLSEELRAIENQQSLFAEDAARKKQIQKKKKSLRSRLEKAQAELNELKNGGNYGHAFEWRFEFPAVLNQNGDYEGFDLVIGNPPYGVSIKGQMRQFLVDRLGKVPDYEIYYLFMNLAQNLVRDGGAVSLIVPNTIMFNVYADKYREAILESWCITEIVDCTDFSVFADATVRNAILFLTKSAARDAIGFKPTDGAKSIDELLARPRKFTSPKILLENNRNWALVFRRPEEVLKLKSKIQSGATTLQTHFPEISQGLIAYDKYTGQDASIIEERSFHSGTRIDESYKEWLWGGDVRKYSVSWNEREYIKYGDGIANPREAKFFNGNRVLVREITSPEIFAGFSSSEQYNDPAIINILEAKDGPISIYCLLGILNSTLATFFHLNSSPKIAKGAFPKILVTDIKEFPLPMKVAKPLERKVTTLAKKAVARRQKEQNADIDDLSSEIDQAVFAIYNLTEEDQQVIRNQLSKFIASDADEVSPTNDGSTTTAVTN
jgi:hypothetical protein